MNIRPKTQAKIVAMLELISSGVVCRHELAEKVGVSHRTIRKYIDMCGVKLPSAYEIVTTRRQAYVEQHRDKGALWLAAKLGVEKSCIYRDIRAIDKRNGVVKVVKTTKAASTIKNEDTPLSRIDKEAYALAMKSRALFPARKMEQRA